MKKALRAVATMLITATLFATLAPCIMAEGNLVSDGSGDSGDTGDLISVNVQWEDLSFVYNEAIKEWNPREHEYSVDDSTAGWKDSNGKITVTNYSDVAIDVDIGFTQSDPPNGTVVLNVDKPKLELDKMADINQPPTAIAIVTASGVPSGGQTLIGTLTVRVEKKT